MAEPLSSSILIANPTLNANPGRYSTFDDSANINRFVQQLRFFLPWRRIKGQLLEVRGHDPGSNVIADFYDHAGAGSEIRAIVPTAYEFAAPPAVPTQQFALKEITALVDVRLLSQQLLSDQFDQTSFQRRALKLAVCARLEFGLINGNSALNSAQFDGLGRLVERGMGQLLNATPSDELEILDEAMTRCRAHNRRVSLIVMNQDAWRRLLQLQRNRGYPPVFRYNKRLQQRIHFYNGIPVCLSDHIVTIGDSDREQRTSLFFMTFGKNGVFGLLSRKRPSIFFTQTAHPTSPFKSHKAHLYCGLASTTSDALVEVANWNVSQGD